MAKELVPKLLSYPRILNIDDMPQLRDKFCYVVKSYPLEGIALLIYRHNQQINTQFGRFNGECLDPTVNGPFSTIITNILSNYYQKLAMLMKYININQAIFYFSECQGELRVVDIRVSLNKFCGPGWLQDFVAKVGIPTQELVGKPVHLIEDNLKKIKDKIGEYSTGAFIVKPSAFKFMIHGDEVIPMYGLIK
jgi:hypothetical protein